MKITLYGAAGGVTGTSYHVKTNEANLLIDCGMFQGGKEADELNRSAPPVDYNQLDSIVLTHAHLDHCGRLPLAIRAGYSNAIYATPATIEIAALILRDSSKIHISDLEKTNRMLARRGKKQLQPLYDQEDVEQAIRQMESIPYRQPYMVAPGIKVIAHEAGHILGAVSLKVIATEEGKEKTVVFSGDLGAAGIPIVKDPEPFTDADMVFMESTYGDRDHKSLKETLEEAVAIIHQAIEMKGKILIPSFAVGRTQDLLYYLDEAFHKDNLPSFPIYLDSPMAIQATKIYLQHPELYDEESQVLNLRGQFRKDLAKIHLTATPEESKRINDVAGTCMIIAGSGMCTAGRIIHHLRHNLWRPETAMVIVGYQAHGTLGRQLVDGAKYVNIFGESIAVKAKIYKLGGFSAHAGQSDLLKWFSVIAPSRPKVVLIHGEDKARTALAKILQQEYGVMAEIPGYGETLQM
ncbi:MAG: MBL fold metallo-hydrolase [Bacteroidia bacterium]|nr:MBL fold metallo-hydrolase [Bacteroidia bacterium]